MWNWLKRLLGMFRALRSDLQAATAKYLVERQVINVLKLTHSQELLAYPRNEWPLVRSKQIEEIRAVAAGKPFNIVDRRSWANPYIPEALHRLNQPLLKNTPYQLRRFAETPIPRRAINLIKNAVLSLRWQVQPTSGEDDLNPEREQRIKIGEESLKRPNNTESFREWMEAVIEDFLLNGGGVIEPRMTPYYQRPFKAWAVDSSTIRMFMDWTEGTPDRPRYAQMTGLKGERGIVTFLDSELIYIRDNCRTSTPFGLGKCEVAYLTINNFLGAQDMAGRAGADQVHKCFPGDTEVLTRRGWMAWRDVGDNEEFATRRADGKFQWQHALGFVREHHKGDMIRFKNRNLSITVTPNHRMYGKWVGKDWRTSRRIFGPLGFIQAAEILDAIDARPGKGWRKGKSKPQKTALYDFRIPTSTRWEDGVLPAPQFKLGERTFLWEDWVAFLGIWIAEGSCLNRGSRRGRNKPTPIVIDALAASVDKMSHPIRKEYRIQIAQSLKTNPGKYAKIKRLLKRMGFNYQAKQDRFIFADRDVWEYLRALGSSSCTKSVPQWIKDSPASLIQVFFDWAMLGDGTKRGKKRTYYTVSKKLAGDMQELFQKLGSSAAVHPYMDDGSLVYAVEEMLRSEISIIPNDCRGEMRKPKRIPFDGMVYCAMVPNGTLYCRENGYAFWSGNTWLWWAQTLQPGHVQTIRRHITNEIEGQAKVSLIAGVQKPDIVEVTPVTPEDLLIEWQKFMIDIIANAFDLSPMALGQTEHVNRAVGQTMADSDFRSSVVPTARRFEEAITRHLLHGFLGWKDLEFKFIDLDDPDALTKTIIQQRYYMMNSITPDEIREKDGMPPLPGGWGKLTSSQLQILTAAELAKLTGKGTMPSSSGSFGSGSGVSTGGGSGAGMGSSGMGGSMMSAADVSSMDPETISLFQEYGILPPTQQLGQQMEQEQPGILETLTDELQQFFQHVEQVDEEDAVGEAPITQGDETSQLQRFAESEHQETLAEKSINKRGVFGPAINQQFRKSAERGKYPRSGGTFVEPNNTQDQTTPVVPKNRGRSKKVKKTYRPGKGNPYR